MPRDMYKNKDTHIYASVRVTAKKNIVYPLSMDHIFQHRIGYNMTIEPVAAVLGYLAISSSLTNVTGQLIQG